MLCGVPINSFNQSFYERLLCVLKDFTINEESLWSAFVRNLTGATRKHVSSFWSHRFRFVLNLYGHIGQLESKNMKNMETEMNRYGHNRERSQID